MSYNAQKKAMDNRANQLNPNNPAYHKSRMGNTQSNKNKNHSNNHKNNNQPKTIVIHHHHNNKPKNNNGQTRSCEICGGKGRLSVIGTGLFGKVQMRCGYCGGTFNVYK